jgi:hypothetical protein
MPQVDEHDINIYGGFWNVFDACLDVVTFQGY